MRLQSGADAEAEQDGTRGRRPENATVEEPSQKDNNDSTPVLFEAAYAVQTFAREAFIMHYGDVSIFSPTLWQDLSSLKKRSIDPGPAMQAEIAV